MLSSNNKTELFYLQILLVLIVIYMYQEENNKL